jgi:hypothetical protein
MAVPWLRWLVAGLSPQTPTFMPGSFQVGLVVDKVAPSSSAVPCQYHSTMSWKKNNRPAAGRSSETSSDLINMNNNNNILIKFSNHKYHYIWNINVCMSMRDCFIYILYVYKTVSQWQEHIENRSRGYIIMHCLSQKYFTCALFLRYVYAYQMA